MEISKDRCFTKVQLEDILGKVKNKTLGEVDVKNVFATTITNPKVTGIAGMVVEQSVLGYKADNKKEADICVDGVMTEVKTTGLKKLSDGKLTAKEPISITQLREKTNCPEARKCYTTTNSSHGNVEKTLIQSQG